MEILWEEEGFQFGFKRWQGWAVSKVLWEWIPNVGSKAREGVYTHVPFLRASLEGNSNYVRLLAVKGFRSVQYLFVHMCQFFYRVQIISINAYRYSATLQKHILWLDKSVNLARKATSLLEYLCTQCQVKQKLLVFLPRFLGGGASPPHTRPLRFCLVFSVFYFSLSFFGAMGVEILWG